MLRRKPLKVEVTSIPQDRKKDFSLLIVLISFVSVIIASYSIFQVIKTREETLNRMDANLRVSNKPLLVLNSEDKPNDIDSTCIILWNAGPGVAYEINIETHLADRGGDNISNPWMAFVLLAAMELETKADSTMSANGNWVWDRKQFVNHPLILPSGIEYGYKTLPLRFSALMGIYVILRYKDAIGNQYYSVWNGRSWKFGDGEGKDIFPIYKQREPVSVFYRDMLFSSTYKRYVDNKDWQTFITFPWSEWLYNQAYLLKKAGYGNIPEKLEKLDLEYEKLQKIN